MFFRLKKTPSGRVLQLTQSYRNQEGKPRQRVILSLGDVTIPPDDHLIIARRIELIIKGETQLLERPLTASQQTWVDRICCQISQRGIKAFTDLSPANISSSSNDNATPRTHVTLPSISSEQLCAETYSTTETSTPSSITSLSSLAKKPDSATRLTAFSLDKVEHTHATSAGAELVGLHAWNQLKLTQALAKCGFNPAQIRCAQATILNRLVDPVSEHALGTWLTQCSSLSDLLGETFAGKHVEGRFYRVADLLHQHASALEAHLRNQQETLFGRRPTIFLYDLTNTYFEGQAEGNPEALHGHSKEKRTDCPLVSIALAYTQDGMPLGHKVFPGNQNDAKSFPEILARLTAEWSDLCQPGQRALFVMDCGIGTPANCHHLRQHHHDYLVSERRSCRTTYAATFAEHQTFTPIQGKNVRVKMQTTAMPPDAPTLPDAPTSPSTPTPAANPALAELPVPEPEPSPTHSQGEPWEETRLFCRSELRSEKEKAMLAKASAHYEADLDKLANSMNGGRINTAEKIHQRLGRLKERHSSVSRYYEITIDSESPTLAVDQLPTPPVSSTLNTQATPLTPATLASPASPPSTPPLASQASPMALSISEKSAALLGASQNEDEGERKGHELKTVHGGDAGLLSAKSMQTPTPRLKLRWARKDEATRAESLCGDYCLHSNRRFENAAAMWKIYIDLNHAEDGFRSLKTDLGLRPVHHQSTERVKSHIFISVLALHLLCFVKKRLAEAAQPARTWTTLKRILSDHAYVTLTLKREKTTEHLRKLGKPNQEQSVLYKALGLKLADCPQTCMRVPR